MVDERPVSPAPDRDGAVGASTDPLARIDVLVVNYNAGPWLARAVTHLRPSGTDRPRLIIVDNGSTDESLDQLLAAIEGLDPARPAGPAAGSLTLDRAHRNLGFSAGVNRAAAQASREFLLILNPDCMIRPEALARLVEELDRHPEAALVSGKVLDIDGLEQRGSRRRLPNPSRVLHEMLPLGGDGLDTTSSPAPGEPIEIEAVSGACMLVRRDAFLELDGMDEGYPLHFEDLDLFCRLKDRGWTLRWVPEAEITHAGGRSSARRPVGVLWSKHRGLLRYLNRHCRSEWPAWQRPLWVLAMAVHLAVRTPIVWARSRLLPR